MDQGIWGRQHETATAGNFERKTGASRPSSGRGTSDQEPAAEVKVGERTAHSWLEDSHFRARVSELRGRMLDSALGRLADAATRAVDTLVALLDAESGSLRLRASLGILDSLSRLREHVEFDGALWRWRMIMRAGMKTRVSRLEASTDNQVMSGQNRIETSRDWLDLFEAWGAAGYFATEPDFPTALAVYRGAVERGDPIPKEWEWLGEMCERVINGKPPVTEAEYRKLAKWYERNESVVYRADLRFALNNTYSAGPHGSGPRRQSRNFDCCERRTLS